MIIHSQGFKPLAMINSGMARNPGLKPGVTQESTPRPYANKKIPHILRAFLLVPFNGIRSNFLWEDILRLLSEKVL
jgi:hypothetical protein